MLEAKLTVPNEQKVIGAVLTALKADQVFSGGRVVSGGLILEFDVAALPGEKLQVQLNHVPDPEGGGAT